METRKKETLEAQSSYWGIRGIVRDCLRVYREKGKEHGNHYFIFLGRRVGLLLQGMVIENQGIHYVGIT